MPKGMIFKAKPTKVQERIRASRNAMRLLVKNGHRKDAEIIFQMSMHNMSPPAILELLKAFYDIIEENS
jgi:hypothetical protein